MPVMRRSKLSTGVGPVLGGTFTAELGDVTRFRSAKTGQLKYVCPWAGLTP